MDERTKRAVIQALGEAHVEALKAVDASLGCFTPEEQWILKRGADDILLCLRHQLEGVAGGEEVVRRIASTVHGHGNPQVSRLLQHYCETLVCLLEEARNRFLRARGKGN